MLRLPDRSFFLFVGCCFLPLAYNRFVSDRYSEMILFSLVEQVCARQGLEAVAAISVPSNLDSAGLDQMIADGIGDMAWMAAYRRLRLNPAEMLPGAISLLAVALPYQPD